MPTSVLMSPAQAALRAKVSRRTIMRATEANDLKAFRDNRNQWKLAGSDLDEWANAHWARSGRDQQKMPTLPTLEISEINAIQIENEVLRERLSAALNKAVAAEKDRDHWIAIATKLAEKPRRKWWLW